MAQQKDRSELEHLRGIVRQQKAEIKHLRSQLKKVSRDSARYKDLQADLEDEEMQSAPQVQGESCSECRSGTLSKEKFGVRVLVKCKSCSYSKWEKSGKG